MVLTLEYSARDAYEQAWSAIDRGEAVDIVVRGWRVPILRRSRPLFEEFFGLERRSARHSAGQILRFALYGWFTVWLLAAYNHAIFTGIG
jgi:hypothetical protein